MSSHTPGGCRAQRACPQPLLEELEPRLLLSATVLYEGFEGAFPDQWVLTREGGPEGVLWGDNCA